MIADANKPHFALRALKSLLPWLIGGAIFGFVLGSAEGFLGWDVGNFVRSALPEFALGASGIVAVMIGGLLIVTAAIIGVGVLWLAAGLKMKVFADLEDWKDQWWLFTLSAIGCFAWGGLLVALALATALGKADSPAVLAGLLVLVLLLAFSCWRILKEFDELWHEINQAASTWAFYGALVFGGGWSALAHLGIVSALSPLDWLSLLTGLSLLGAVIANGRRGLLEEHL